MSKDSQKGKKPDLLDFSFTENDVQTYSKNVSNAMNIEPFQLIDLNEPGSSTSAADQHTPESPYVHVSLEDQSSPFGSRNTEPELHLQNSSNGAGNSQKNGSFGDLDSIPSAKGEEEEVTEIDLMAMSVKSTQPSTISTVDVLEFQVIDAHKEENANHIVYIIESRLKSPTNSRGDLSKSISRRYSELMLLREVLEAKYVSVIIPPLPKLSTPDRVMDTVVRQVLRFQSTRHQLEIIHGRRRQAERFLNAIGRHKILSKDVILDMFMTSDDFKESARLEIKETQEKNEELERILSANRKKKAVTKRVRKLSQMGKKGFGFLRKKLTSNSSKQNESTKRDGENIEDLTMESVDEGSGSSSSEDGDAEGESGKSRRDSIQSIGKSKDPKECASPVFIRKARVFCGDAEETISKLGESTEYALQTFHKYISRYGGTSELWRKMEYSMRLLDLLGLANAMKKFAGGIESQISSFEEFGTRYIDVVDRLHYCRGIISSLRACLEAYERRESECLRVQKKRDRRRVELSTCVVERERKVLEEKLEKYDGVLRVLRTEIGRFDNIFEGEFSQFVSDCVGEWRDIMYIHQCLHTSLLGDQTSRVWNLVKAQMSGL